MRDYSFGNYISVLRERRGLSQFQLGALVGVSDKAVSKWENGVSKPRIGTVTKLAEVLDVCVDELLTCEYVAFNEKRKDLFAMRREIIELAKSRMAELYGENPSIRITNRFKTEELMLSEQEALLWMGFMGKLNEEFCKAGAYFEVRDAQMGASFIAWLLGGTNVNPLPAHYYCPRCKRVEFITEVQYGIDAPDKKCACGESYRKDGFGIDAIHIYPFSKSNEIYVSNSAGELVKNCLMSYFDGYGELRELQIVYDETDDKRADNEWTITKYALLSKEDVKKYQENIILVNVKEYCKMMKEVPILTILDHKKKRIKNRYLPDAEYSGDQIKSYIQYASEHGYFYNDFINKDLGTILKNIKNPKFSDLIAVLGLLHGTGTWQDNGELLYERGMELENLISCREDVYAFLYHKLNGKCCDNPVGQVFDIRENVRMGRYARTGMPEETKRLLLDCEVPEWYVESMKKIKYLFPKTNLIIQAKRELLIYNQGNEK